MSLGRKKKEKGIISLSKCCILLQLVVLKVFLCTVVEITKGIDEKK